MTGCIIKDVKSFMDRYIEVNGGDIGMLEDILYCNEGIVGANGREIDAQIYDDCRFYDSVVFNLLDHSEPEHLKFRYPELPFIFIPADRQLSTESVLNGEFYHSKEELVDEMKAKIGAYVPEDFSIEGNLGDLEYAAWG